MSEGILKQANMFGNDAEEDNKYSSKIEAPIYEPKNKKPHLMELLENTKTKQLIREISDSEVTEEEKAFLIEAAKRHNVFNYEKTADYYAHSSETMQRLMEKSALVIIDFKKAIECGYVKLCEEIKAQYMEEYTDGS
jgi:hypothetical protein